MDKELIYESPKVTVVKFELEDAIAMSSTTNFFGALGGEEFWEE